MRTPITAIGLSLAVALAATAGSPVGAQSVKTAGTAAATAAMRAPAASSVVQVATGRGKLVTLARPMSDIFIADDSIADVQVRSPTQLYVFGKKGGETTISATTKSGAVVFSSVVRVGNNFDSLQSMLALAMPEAHVTATPLNGIVLLTGTVATPEDGAEAERLVQAMVGDGTKVLSRLKTATPLQVNLQVRIAEVSRGFAKNINSNLTTRDASGGFLFGIAQGRQGAISTVPGNPPAGFINGAPVDAAGNAIPVDANGAYPGNKLFTFPSKGAVGATIGLAGRLLGVDVINALDLGETIGQVTTLANPNLTAISGETGTFLAGGELPIPISQGLGAVSVEFKQYGIGLAYTPTVLADGRISLRVRPEVSQLDYSNAVTLGGTRIPGLLTRRTETTVELGSGQSMMISGLLSNSHNNSIEKTPGLGNLPILGALFRSNGFIRNETELVIVITPYLVKPVNNASDIVLPTDGYKAPTDLQRVLLGELGSGTTGAKRPVPTMAGDAPVPTAGAVAPVAPTPSPLMPAPAPRADARGLDKRKAASPAPGFSN
ncbi:pilus assembly protein CpaC [Sphingomonas jinjuensis]|uniref:Pilus assembly protein CpaC n=1 Tax=Sphingomonas jinjuensis TaxID=535907 RepID=A0A840FI27_9SPHN|nr:type II and III secretion system protein family protein [Sphingomonas jinjuensis]MBB4155347.1 pilus assembly protein CpaC [Sphingomonas jinjuensis]